jgi:putative transposase
MAGQRACRVEANDGSFKCEEIYIRGYEAVPELHRGLATYFAFYNDERLHQSLDYRTPAAVYRGTTAKKG